MKTYPLHSISLEQAKQLQFKVIDAVTRNFQGEEVLSLGRRRIDGRGVPASRSLVRRASVQ